MISQILEDARHMALCLNVRVSSYQRRSGYSEHLTLREYMPTSHLTYGESTPENGPQFGNGTETCRFLLLGPFPSHRLIGISWR